FNAVCLGLSHVVSLRLLRHLARDTFFRGKVTNNSTMAFIFPDMGELRNPSAQANHERDTQSAQITAPFTAH
ncbi:hypothetical protein, partial [Pseudomonas syringae]